jgi:phage terminase large subunit-like protein
LDRITRDTSGHSAAKSARSALFAEVERIRRQSYGLRGFSAFCKLLRLEDGSAFKLEPFQKALVALYFFGVTELIIIMPKKNGKTTLMAALALYHLLMTPGAECVIGAASEEQAAIIYRQARKMVLRAGLDRRPLGRDRSHSGPVAYEGIFDVRPGIHEIRYEVGRIRVLPAKIEHIQGQIPTLALVDEYHCHPTSDMYSAFRDGLTGDARMVTITNPGTDASSPLGQLRSQITQHPCQVQGRRRQFSSPDGSVVLVEWGLEPTDDPDDIEVVWKANPASWQTKTALRRRHDSPSTRRVEWLRYGCGLWTNSENPWLDERMWDGLAVDIGGVTDGDEVFVAVRVGVGVGIGIASPRGEDSVAVSAQNMAPTGPGRVSLAELEPYLRGLVERYDVREIAYDRDQLGLAADVLENEGLPMVEVPQRIARLSQASATLWRLISTGALMHDGDPMLRDQVLAGQMKERTTGAYLVGTDQTRALIAVAMACYEAIEHMGDHAPQIHFYRGA